MKVLIIEDEFSAAKRLSQLLKEVEPSAVVVDTLDSIENSVEWLKTHIQPDLVLLDIHLADGSSFEIFKSAEIKAPIIFTTAYDEHAIDAFKVNSIAYLLKPIKKEELAAALQKLKNLQTGISSEAIHKLTKTILSRVEQSDNPKRFVVRYGETIKAIEVDDIAYAFAENKNVFIRTKHEIDYPYDTSLDQLMNGLSPKRFYRANRALIVSIDSIENMVSVSKSRVKLKLVPSFEHDSIVSTNRSGDFKKWLTGKE